MDNRLRRMFDQVKMERSREEAILADLLRDKKEVKPMRKNKKMAVVLAAAAMLLLATSALAAAGVPGMLSNWLSQRWEEDHNAPMEENQVEFVNHLTQPVGVSDTVNGVTVTVDSVTVGDNTIWALLVVDGLEAPLAEQGTVWDDTYHTGWDECSVEPFSGAEDMDMAGAGFGIYSAEVIDGERLCMIHSYTTQMTGKSSFLDGCHAVYQIEKIVYGNQTLAEGPWVLAFDTEPIEGIACITLDGEQVSGLDELERVRVSASGVTFVWNYDEEHYVPNTALIFRDGSEVSPAPGEMYFMNGDNGDCWIGSCEWPAPVDLTQAESLRIGETVFPLQ